MSSDSDNDGHRNTMGNKTQTEAGRGNDETDGSEPIRSRRSTLIGTAVGSTLLSGANRTAAAQPGQRWQRDVDATGNDLLNLGGLNMDVMAEDAAIDGIEVERIEPPENKNLNVESSEDLVLSISGGQGAVRIETDDGHEVVLDDESESLSVKDSGGNSVKMDANTGEVSISASEKITLDAPEIELSAGAGLNIQSGGNAELMSSGVVDIEGALVQLNGPGAPAARQGDPVDDDDDLILAGSTTVLIG